MSLNSTATLYHTVFFWMKNPNNKKDRFEFEKAVKKLLGLSIAELTRRPVESCVETTSILLCVF